MIADGAALGSAVELLERSLAYTSGTLAGVRPGHLQRPTPCEHWSLADLLTHMEDALDAFTEAAAGYVEVRRPPPSSTSVDALRDKACALLGSWLAAPAGSVVVGDAGLGAATLVSAAALEITLHGWDVGQVTGRGAPVPGDLAKRLMPIAGVLVEGSGRHPQFAPARPVAADADAETRLLAWTGRGTEPPLRNHAVSPSRRRLAS